MSELSATRDHCKLMAKADHKRECRGTIRDRWGKKDIWPNPRCAGCVTPAERDLWLQLADEIDAYLAAPTASVDLFGMETTEPTHEGEPA